MRCKKHYCQEADLGRIHGDLHYVKTGGRYYDIFIVAQSLKDYQGISRISVTPILFCKQHSAELLLPTLDHDPEASAAMNEWALKKLQQVITPRAGGFIVSGARKKPPHLRKYKVRR